MKLQAEGSSFGAPSHSAAAVTPFDFIMNIIVFLNTSASGCHDLCAKNSYLTSYFSTARWLLTMLVLWLCHFLLNYGVLILRS